MRTLITETFRRLHDRWSRRHIAQETERSLGSLDTRTLRDLGLHRSEIGSVAWEVARRVEHPRANVARHHAF